MKNGIGADDLRRQLLDNIGTREARICVVGLGYVGLPLALSFGEANFRVNGIDVDGQIVERLNCGISHVTDIPSERLKALPGGVLEFSEGFSEVGSCDVVIICVPTPLGKTRDPDLSFVINATQAISRHLRPGMLVLLESTTYPGTTEEVVRPLLEESNLKMGEDFFLAFSPERIDPGRQDFTLVNTPKIVGGVTPECTEVAVHLYEQIVERVVPVTSTGAAEMVKLLENTYRAVNIALVNEVAIMCDRLGLDVWEVVEAAATKPFGFMPFTPGPGVGGHCIPLDPHYLSWKLKTLDYNARFIELAGEINSTMPAYWVGKVQDSLNSAEKSVKGSTVVIVGVAYKKDVDDVRESPALDIIALLQRRGAEVSYVDPYVPRIRADGIEMKRKENVREALRSADCVVVVTDHTSFDWEMIASESEIIVDTRNVIRHVG
jgi:UDP-N-acetyl-D-glucosamine dehydrogenase